MNERPYSVEPEIVSHYDEKYEERGRLTRRAAGILEFSRSKARRSGGICSLLRKSWLMWEEVRVRTLPGSPGRGTRSISLTPYLCICGKLKKPPTISQPRQLPAGAKGTLGLFHKSTTVAMRC